MHLIKRCLDANPLNRPTANELSDISWSWHYDFKNPNNQIELKKQIKEAEEINNKSPASNMPSTSLALSYETHSKAVYTSRLLNFNELPGPKNSDDYYKQDDNIISKKYSGN